MKPSFNQETATQTIGVLLTVDSKLLSEDQDPGLLFAGTELFDPKSLQSKTLMDEGEMLRHAPPLSKALFWTSRCRWRSILRLSG